MQKNTTINKTDMRIENLVASIENTILMFGIPPMLKGYRYIISAELMLFENSDCINKLRGEVYPKIAAQHYTSTERVERAIRHAIEISCSREDEKSLKNCCSNNLIKPTIGEFLQLIQNWICRFSENS